MKSYSVLVADDEEWIRILTRSSLEMLTQEGYELQVCEALDGQTALEIIAQHVQQGKCIDLLISDINMGSMNGLQLVAEAKKISPPTKYVLFSASMGDYRQQAEALGAIALSKPFLPSNLLAKVRSLLPLQTRQTS